MSLQEKSIAEITATYNELAAAKGFKPVKKFSTKGDAIARYEARAREFGVAKSNGSGGKRRTGPRLYNLEQQIVVLVDGNPMREGKRSHEQFAILARANGKTVGEYIESFKCSPLPTHLATATLRWCVKKGFVEIR